ncbi:kinase-like domain-containing protein [Flagelloscypha sp. PMI_526]|nr:kinase-like domain-containing protein [Flagelloscypha sp. PMI_526]
MSSKSMPNEDEKFSFDSLILKDLTAIVQVLPNALNHMVCGGSGDIYKAQLRELNHSSLVAVKVPRIHGQLYPQETVVKFLREVVLWSILKHPHIAPCLGVTFSGQNMGIPTVVMPWYDHGSLAKYLSSHHAVGKLTFVLQVASAIQYLHSLEIAHGDIKAQNVLVASESPPLAVLTDFGLSRPLYETQSFETSHVQGTLHFMAPELLQHLIYDGLCRDRQCTKETDIWAFGMFIVQVLSIPLPLLAQSDLIQVYTSRLPLTLPPDRRTEFELAHLVVLEGYLPSPEDASEVPPKIWQSGVLQSCWKYIPKRRNDMQQVIKVLNEIREG